MEPTMNSSDISSPPFKRRSLLSFAAAIGVIVTPIGRAMAQSWPDRPIRLIVPFSPGGLADVAARVIGKKIGEILGQPVNIDNKPGGNSVLAAHAALNAPKDGYTFLWDSPPIQLTNPVLIKNLPFDYRTAFIPISLAIRSPSALVVRGDFPAKTVEEFIASARAKPGTVSCGTSPVGGMGHLAMELFQRRAGIKLLHTAYKGGSDAQRDVMAGQIDSAFITSVTASAAAASGKCRLLAITSSHRLPSMPDVPTIAELGFPGFDMDSPLALYAATGTPELPIQKMLAALKESAKDPAMKKVLDAQGVTIVANSPAEFSAWQDQQREVLQKLVRDSNVKLG
jgi:tripartite-type tricarboxylate transporter receptor subunit TctC